MATTTSVSVLFNEPKLLKLSPPRPKRQRRACVSVLFNEPKLLKFRRRRRPRWIARAVSVLFNEPKLLKLLLIFPKRRTASSFSALQRAEIAEIMRGSRRIRTHKRVSVLFNEPKLLKLQPHNARVYPRSIVSVLFNEPKLLKFPSCHQRTRRTDKRFSALQRAEIAEIGDGPTTRRGSSPVSVLFNEPKLLKFPRITKTPR